MYPYRRGLEMWDILEATFEKELYEKVQALPRKSSQYLSEHDSNVFQEPQCLIRAGAGNKLEICDNVLEEISHIDKPCVIVAVAGLYRTGKSFLMNLLASKHKGFVLGDTVQSMTKGIWVWCILHPVKHDTVLMLLDTEGLGDPEKGDANHDNRIFTLATLLCGTLVYNMKGAFDQDAVNKLTFVSEMAKNIRFGGECNEDNDLLHCVLPGFVLALRDFSLKMVIDGRKVTPDEYLDIRLQNKTRKDGSFNKPLECIRKFFPQDKRRCFAFPVPGDGDTLDNLDSLTLQDLSKIFQNVAAQFVSYIFSQEPKQLQVSKPVNGYMFATLTRQYVNYLAKGAVPDVDDAFTAVAKLENERVKKECLEIFQSRMDDILLPIPAMMFNKHLTEAQWCALKYMRENAVEDVDNAVEKYAEIEMELIGQKKQEENDEEIGKHCTNVLSSLKSLNDLKIELHNQTFEVLGGYKNFKRGVDIAKQEYEQALRDYEHREIVFPWSAVADWLGEAENQILEKDDALSEEEKQRERMEYANSIERMKVEMAEANQTALDKQKNELEEQQKELNAERERLEKEHEHQVKILQEKGMERESDKEQQNKTRDKQKAKQKVVTTTEYEKELQRMRDKINKLKKMDKERKEKNILSRVWAAICNY